MNLKEGEDNPFKLGFAFLSVLWEEGDLNLFGRIVFSPFIVGFALMVFICTGVMWAITK